MSEYNNMRLPTLWFDKDKMFVKSSTKHKITQRVLQFYVNMTALITMN